MNKLTKTLATASTMLALASTAAFAAPVEKTDGFICPVLNDVVGQHNPNAVQIGGGDFSIIGPQVSIPVHATNQDGAGTPGGDHASPGDTDYTAIWAL